MLSCLHPMHNPKDCLFWKCIYFKEEEGGHPVLIHLVSFLCEHNLRFSGLGPVQCSLFSFITYSPKKYQVFFVRTRSQSESLSRGNWRHTAEPLNFQDILRGQATHLIEVLSCRLARKWCAKIITRFALINALCTSRLLCISHMYFQFQEDLKMSLPLLFRNDREGIIHYISDWLNI